GNKLIERHNLERCLGGAGLLQHKDTESKTTSKCYGFVSSLKAPNHPVRGLFLKRRGMRYQTAAS
ncbi:hypothetical protein, partial [Roseibium litorale]|uniref:hypothetical protein n=1 Tax=Roseibium litorale TaxID=2803841 RepID=UPI001AD8B4E0